MSKSKYKNSFPQQSQDWDDDYYEHVDFDDDRDDESDDYQSSDQFSSQERYQFDIRDGKVIGVFESENNRLKQEQIDSGESYILQGQDVLKIEQERNGREITTYTDLDKDGIFIEEGQVWQTNIIQSVGGAVTPKALTRIDHDDSATQVYRLYKAAFARTPDQDGLRYWVTKSKEGLTLEDTATAFMNSQEFESKYGSQLSTDEFLNNLYLNVLDREADSSGLQWWKNSMNNNPALSRNKVLVEFSESAENKLSVAAELEALQDFDVSLVGVSEQAILG
ncbi:MAG: DUF4214 domain-containing protein [Limnobacter sp.]|nr:DUF4214 domain-containing protein [Limnobacter sp.]